MVKKKEVEGRAEEVAEKTGEVICEGLKKGWGIAKGLEKAVKEKEEK